MHGFQTHLEFNLHFNAIVIVNVHIPKMVIRFTFLVRYANKTQQGRCFFQYQLEKTTFSLEALHALMTK